MLSRVVILEEPFGKGGVKGRCFGAGGERRLQLSSVMLLESKAAPTHP